MLLVHVISYCAILAVFKQNTSQLCIIDCIYLHRYVPSNNMNADPKEKCCLTYCIRLNYNKIMHSPEKIAGGASQGTQKTRRSSNLDSKPSLFNGDYEDKLDHSLQKRASYEDKPEIISHRFWGGPLFRPIFGASDRRVFPTRGCQTLRIARLVATGKEQL